MKILYWIAFVWFLIGIRKRAKRLNRIYSVGFIEVLSEQLFKAELQWQKMRSAYGNKGAKRLNILAVTLVVIADVFVCLVFAHLLFTQ